MDVRAHKHSQDVGDQNVEEDLGALAPVLSGEPAPVPVPDPTPDPDPFSWLVLSRPLWPHWLSRFFWRAITSFAFTVASSAVSLPTVEVSCEMATQSLAVDVAKFAMASTGYFWRYSLSRFAVALCAAL